MVIANDPSWGQLAIHMYRVAQLTLKSCTSPNAHIAEADTSTDAKNAMLPSTVLPSAGDHRTRPTLRPMIDAWCQLLLVDGQCSLTRASPMPRDMMP